MSPARFGMALAVSSAMFLSGVAGAAAQDVIRLKLAHQLPATHYLWEQGLKPLAEAVTAATQGQVQFDVYPAGQLGKDYYVLLKGGIADITMIVTSYAPDKFPLSSVTELPGIYSTACEATGKFWELAKPGGPLNEGEYAPLGLHVLFVSTLPSYRFSTATKKVTRLEDAGGLKIWANGAAMDKTIRSLGAVPIRMTAAELLDSVTRGTIDGAFFPYSSLSQYRLESRIGHVVEGVQLGSGSLVVAMSAKGWNGLPEKVRDSMMVASSRVQRELCAWMDGEQDGVRQRLVKENGLTVTTLTDEQAALWKERVDGVAAAWAQEMDKLGRNGTALLQAFRAAAPGP